MDTQITTLPCGPANPKAVGQFEDSRYIENIMEHVFLSELLQHCWFILHQRVEVIRPDVDAGGYDLVLEANGRVRHVQLKSRWQHGGNRILKRINSRLRDHPNPCVVWIFWEADPATCRVGLQYKYSEEASWPLPVDAAATFPLKWADFFPGYLDIAALATHLF